MRITLLNKVSIALLLSIFVFSYCGHDEYVAPENLGPTDSDTELLSHLTSETLKIDGDIDEQWQKLPKLITYTEVPDAGNFLWPSYIGQKQNVSMRSMYDKENIYFLVEWDDPTQNQLDRTWYFNTSTKRWLQESGNPVFDANGVKTRDAFNEDKFGVLWNINNSTPGFKSQTCYASCHMNQATTTTNLPTGGTHYTNGINQRIDMWHLHILRDQPFGLMSDEYQDYGAGAINANGRKTDTQINATDGSTNNRQTLNLLGTTTSVTVPRWFKPLEQNYYYILAKDTLPGGDARLITAVDSLGKIYYDNNKVLDPTSETAFQQNGTSVGAKCIPPYIVSPMSGNRADISAKVKHTGKGYILEIKRKLKTPDTLNQDVDFSSLEDQPFGIAIFNQANNAHGLRPNLLLKFKK